MRVVIEVEMDNAAFDDPGELSNVLQRAIDISAEAHSRDDLAALDGIRLMDSDGNGVGRVALYEDLAHLGAIVRA